MMAFGQTPIPFTELVTLGGPDDLRGFRRGRFRGASSMLATIEYRWPVWMWMDGSFFVDYGGVFGPGFSDFRFGALRPDVGIGLRAHTSSRYLVRVQLAWGFGGGGGIRFVVAGNGNPS
jgi:outer membrane protein assembly factor BamA